MKYVYWRPHGFWWFGDVISKPASFYTYHPTAILPQDWR